MKYLILPLLAITMVACVSYKPLTVANASIKQLSDAIQQENQ
jgi:hypothetical protein